MGVAIERLDLVSGSTFFPPSSPTTPRFQTGFMPARRHSDRSLFGRYARATRHRAAHHRRLCMLGCSRRRRPASTASACTLCTHTLRYPPANRTQRNSFPCTRRLALYLDHPAFCCRRTKTLARKSSCSRFCLDKQPLSKGRRPS